MIPSINNQQSTARGAATALARQLTAAGCRLTQPRQAILSAIAEAGESFTAAHLLERVTEAAPETGRATVFRTLELLVELGMLRRLHTESAGTWGHTYVLCGLGEQHHHHLVCTRCGRVVDFSGCALDSLVGRLEAQTSFEVRSHQLEFYGLCRECRGEERS